ncbi:3-hydroxyacyl-CoA dehydrogenase family protein [Clostridium sp. PL3]|uniref:3-hydroxyacyl-CoA dehydrogenase family protein n=1 Tax=Clostridium thailandense TaxID=2794346 RepID=A0A949TW31_9CLOT|nr:3-hydroxyacyl-CoA dehydrogenase NAD-binding domain-containing protein [Clostridium thailandense]MBV7276402.1 3-hydroxyacyl-CoA dehydrogenase family protein [Clostridium thailandense]
MIKKIAVIGAGTMGHSIAGVFALYGYPVNLFDAYEETLKKVKKTMKNELLELVEESLFDEETVIRALGNITLCNKLEDAISDRDYIIEATPENIELKRNLFATMDKLAPDHAIFASNTSSLPLNEMLVSVSDERKKRMMVNHWYNPALLMPIVEMSFFGNMPEEIFEEVEKLFKSIKKQTIKVLKDVPGLVANRIQQGVAREVFSLIEQGVAEPAEIDKALKFGPAFRYATTGQLEVADLGGLDIWCTVSDNLLKEIDNSTCANPILREKVKEGKLGIKSGAGFYNYNPDEIEKVRKEFNRRLIHQLKASEFYIK